MIIWGTFMKICCFFNGIRCLFIIFLKKFQNHINYFATKFININNKRQKFYNHTFLIHIKIRISAKKTWDIRKIKFLTKKTYSIYIYLICIVHRELHINLNTGVCKQLTLSLKNFRAMFTKHFYFITMQHSIKNL